MLIFAGAYAILQEMLVWFIFNKWIKLIKPLPTTYTLHNQTLEVVPCARYLRVDISHDLSWKPHIDRITGNANKFLGFLRRNLKAKNLQLRERAYKAIVRPQLEYAAPVWDPHTQDDIDKIEMVQRRAARWVLNDYSP